MTLGFLYAFGAAITWGLVYTIDQKILTGVSPLLLLFISDVIAAFILLPFVIFDRSGLYQTLRGDTSTLILLGIALLLGMIANLMIFSSIRLIGAPTASMIEIAYPLAVVLFSFAFYRSAPSMAVIVGGAFIFLGSVIIAYFGR